MKQQNKKVVYRAGVIPFYVGDTDIFMMFMKPTTKYGDGDNYQIAKGKIEDEETPLQAGLREAKEELGLVESNIEYIQEIGVYMGRTHIFVAKIKKPALFDVTTSETQSTLWMSLTDFENTGRKLHIPVVQEVYNEIEQLENYGNK